MDLGFKGKVALITGAGSQIGFGKEIATLLAKEGCDAIAVTDIIPEDVKKTAEAIKKIGRKSIAVKADITNPAEVQAMVKKIIDEYGKIDILINVAGGVIGGGPFEEQSVELWSKNVNLNLYGTMLVSQAVVPYMKQKKYGVIVNIGSGSSHQYGPPHGVGMYAIAKAAVDVFTKQLATVEAGSGIRVNCVNPGVIATPFHERFSTKEMIDRFVATIPQQRLGKSEEVAKVIAFLVSDNSTHLVGECIEVNGGLLMD